MADPSDKDLTQEFADRHSEPAFAQLVQRHVNLVYSVALRITGNSTDAEDVAQEVFVIFAKKAARLRQRAALAGWLYETTWRAARQLVRGRVRQQAREQEACAQSTLNDSNTSGIWRQLAPLLEEAMSRLNEKERALLVLRFYENKSGAETAALLGIQEWAAHKRTMRAVEKLRVFFAKRGVAISAGGLAAVISTHAVQAAPVGLTVAISTAAIAGTTLAATASATAAKAIAMTTFQKTAAIVLVVGLAGAGVHQTRQIWGLRDQNAALQQQLAPLAEQARRLTLEQTETTRQMVQLREENARLNRDGVELLKLRGEVAIWRQQNKKPEDARVASPPEAQDASDYSITPEDAQIARMESQMQKLSFAIRRFQISHPGAPLITNATMNADLMKEIPAEPSDGDWEDIEFIAPIAGGSETSDNPFVARTRTAIQDPTHPQKIWRRVYLLADGTVQVIGLDSPSQLLGGDSSRAAAEPPQNPQ